MTLRRISKNYKLFKQKKNTTKNLANDSEVIITNKKI